MELRNYYDFDDLVNEAERLVIDEVGARLDEPEHRDLLDNEDLVRDIVAYSLNHVRPMYRANLLGRLYAQSMDTAESDEVRAAVDEAIKKVRENP